MGVCVWVKTMATRFKTGCHSYDLSLFEKVVFNAQLIKIDLD